jgi:malic enzyme
MRHLDIKLVVTLGLGAAAFGIVFLLQHFALNNVPEENVVYIDATVGGIEDDPLRGVVDETPIPLCDMPNECGPANEDSPP